MVVVVACGPRLRSIERLPTQHPHTRPHTHTYTYTYTYTCTYKYTYTYTYTYIYTYKITHASAHSGFFPLYSFHFMPTHVTSKFCGKTAAATDEYCDAQYAGNVALASLKTVLK